MDRWERRNRREKEARAAAECGVRAGKMLGAPGREMLASIPIKESSESHGGKRRSAQERVRVSVLELSYGGRSSRVGTLIGKGAVVARARREGAVVDVVCQNSHLSGAVSLETWSAPEPLAPLDKISCIK